MKDARERIVSGKQGLIKEINRNLLIKLVIRHGRIGRAELAKLTGLSLPSVMRITEALMSEGLLEEVGKGASSGGRKPNLLTLKSDAFYIIGVEIALHTTVVLTDLSGSILDRWESGAASDISPEGMLEKINGAITALLETHHIPWDRFAGIGIGTPGANYKYNQEMELSILKGWENLNVKGWFETRRRHDGYRILTENVARTRTLNELWFGLGKAYKSFLYVFVDRGVGCGFVNNEVIYLGQNDVAGEFGHSLIHPGGRPCYCGNRGCMEMYVSAGAITREVKRVMDIREKDFGFEDVMAMTEKPEVAAVLRQSGETLGYGVANLINLYNPKAVILGGDVPKGNPLFVNQAMETARGNVFSMNAMGTPIEVSGIGSREDCLGSVALVINDMFRSVEL